jgi:hypothetical protein
MTHRSNRSDRTEILTLKGDRMKLNYKPILVALTVAVLASLAIRADAAPMERAIRLSFSQPVEIPGMVLPAGSYVFEDLQLGGLTRIWDANGLHVLTTVVTVPTERREPEEKSGVILKENGQHSPERVDAWFAPWESIGSEFVYTKASHKDVGKTIAVDVGRGTAISAEFAAAHAEHFAERLGVSVAHAVKYLVA